MISLKSGSVKLNSQTLLEGLSLKLSPGELSILMGRNAAGKSTFVSALSAAGKFTTSGRGHCCGLLWSNRSHLSAAKAGAFLAFQNPIEMPGVLCFQFLKLIANRAGTSGSLASKVNLFTNLFNVNPSLFGRKVNISFSGGERRLFEFIQMLIMEPQFCILDELDSSLDFIKLKSMSKLVSSFSISRRVTFIITHNRKLVSLLNPDNIYLLANGQLVQAKR
ncbi:MAG: ATP-binding cassette domain-containing protein [Candidatus Hodgkinia cicadicola]